MPVNLELKARCAQWETARAVAERSGAIDKGILHQRDTYFRVQTGRLKLRVINDATAELIQYERAEDGAERFSRYRKIDVADPDGLREALAESLGTLVEVKKERHLYMYGATRIHLDRVESLGSFIEFEIPGSGNGVTQELMGDLRRMFGIDEKDVVTCSYADLLMRRSQNVEINAS